MTSSKQHLIIFLLICVNALMVKAQDGVSIGRPAPDESAILHITAPSNNKGILFPFGVPTTIRDIINPSDGLFVYDSVFHRFAYYRRWNNGQGRSDHSWMYLNPWDTEQLNPDNGPEPNEDITYISTPYEVRVNNDLSADHLDGFGVVPIGGIIMWSGPVQDIPSNYELCDGGSRNGVTIPNLVGRFIRAAASADVTTGGGVNTNAMTEISFIETPRETINNTNCQSNQFNYTATYRATCDPPGDPVQQFDFSATSRISCQNALDELRGMIILENGNLNCTIGSDFPTTCSTQQNPNYFRRPNSPCINNAVREVDVATGTENRPQFYDLAYIIRVE